MRLGGRLAAAIEILDDMERRHRPAAEALKDWGLSHRFAGAGDRAAIGNVVYDALRRRRSAGWLLDADTSRAQAFGAMLLHGRRPGQLAEAFEGDRFAPAPLDASERAAWEGRGHFLAVAFPHDQLRILPYNRVVRDLHGHTSTQLLDALRATFEVEPLAARTAPSAPQTFTMFLDGRWFLLKPQFAHQPPADDPVARLDVSLLQDRVLDPILGIADPRTDERIDFVGGIRGLEELERRVRADAKVAFAMYPTSLDELMDIADAGRVMPPKSTWFEPKLRSGLVISRF